MKILKCMNDVDINDNLFIQDGEIVFNDDDDYSYEYPMINYLKTCKITS